MHFADLQICFFHRLICFLLEIFPGIRSGRSDGGRGEGPTWLALDKKFLFLQKSRNLMKVGRSHYFTQTLVYWLDQGQKVYVNPEGAQISVACEGYCIKADKERFILAALKL